MRETDLTQEEYSRYARHLVIPEIGLDGQRKLKQSSVLIVGMGGLGSSIALYLASAGVGHIGIVDYDLVEESNLQRQIIHDSTRLGEKKVDSARKRLLDLNPLIEIDKFDTVFTSDNAKQIALGYQILIDGCDNLPTRYLMNDLAVLTKKPFVYGSVFRFEGQTSVFDAQKGPCYRCLFPMPPAPEMIPSCKSGGILGVLPGIIGTIQALQTIKLITGIGESLIGKMLILDGFDLDFRMITISKSATCPVCGATPQITSLMDYERFCGSNYADRTGYVD